jgi:ABC-type antimicrobial peptide transport system permease subunit
MAYVVMRRTREIGIRIALGALRSNVIAMVMREVFILIGAGLAAGIALALALANLIRSQLYGLNPRDPLTSLARQSFLLWPRALPAFCLPCAQAVSIRQPHYGRNDSVRAGHSPCRACALVVGKSPSHSASVLSTQ